MIGAGALAVGLLAASVVGPIMSQVEQPEYKIEVSDGNIELRSYAPMIVARAVVQGPRKVAINQGFRLIAAYIFGQNAPRVTIEMTAPVKQQKQTIEMTAPVTQQAEGDAWVISFIMPKSWTLDTLPAPSDARVTLEPVPARRFVVITFSGLAGDAIIEKRTNELRRYAADRRLTTIGEPQLAFYNPPWTLPFLRRNEIMLELSGPAISG